MVRRRMLVVTAAAGLLLANQIPGHSQGLSQNQFEGLVERTVASVRFGTLPDFTIERVNPVDRSDSYVVLTFDSQGRLVVSKENDFPRLLLDNDGDGIYESEKVISEQVRNCQGLWFDGPVLYGSCAMANPPAPTTPPAAGGRGGRGPAAPAGIFRMADTNGDDVADTFETLAMAGSIQEHGPHAIRRTPSGSWMVVVGNNETIADPYLDLSSSVLKDVDGQFLPYFANFGRSARQGAHSALFEWDQAQRKFRVFSGGNRNAYDFAYNLDGEAFLFDSDMEWDIGLPWYREVRTVHQILNGDYGYRDGSGKYPAYYVDSLPPVRDLGRGSPVGVETYQSDAYPRQFFDMLFEADWSRGRILYTPLTRAGATYTTRTDRAELIHGEPLNVTDMEVGPDGMLYFSTGGRNTRGGLWRLRYTGTAPAAPDKTGILAVTRQAQPLSSWGWAAIERVKTSMGAQAFGSALEQVARNASADVTDRTRALYEMQRHGAAPTAALLAALATDAQPMVRAAAMFVVGVQGGADVRTTAAAGLRDADPMVTRRAAEALVRLGQSPDRESLAPVDDIYALLGNSDRFVRFAGRLLLEHTRRADWQARVLTDTNATSAPEAMVAWARTAGTASVRPLIDRQLALIEQAAGSVDDQLRLYRAFMLTTTFLPGGEGLPAADRQRLHAALINRFPSTDERLNRQLALMLAYGGQPEAVTKILAAMPEGNSNQELTLHYLYALRAVQSGWTAAQKERLAEVLGQTSRWRGGAQFANFLGQYFQAFDPLYVTDAEKKMLYAKAPDFAPLTDEELNAMAPAGRGGAAGRAGGAPAAAGRGAAAAAGRGAAVGAAGPGGGRGASTGIQARTQGRVLDKGEVFDEVIYTPRTQQPDAAAGRTIFEASCASCHRAGGLGDDHGVAALDLTSSARAANRRDLLESIMFPSRQVAPELRTSVLTANDGTTVRGLVVAETAQAFTVLRTDGTTTTVTKPVRAHTREQATVMLDSLTDAMSQAQLTNLLAFLQP